MVRCDRTMHIDLFFEIPPGSACAGDEPVTPGGAP